MPKANFENEGALFVYCKLKGCIVPSTRVLGRLISYNKTDGQGVTLNDLLRGKRKQQAMKNRENKIAS